MANTSASFTISGITDSSATINVRAGTGYTQVRILVRLASSSSDVSGEYYHAMGTFSWTASGLMPGTDYLVNVASFIPDVASVWAGSQAFTTKAAPKTRPTDWKWRSTVAANKPIAISAAEWKAFYDKIDEFRAYTGREKWPNFIPVSKGTPISADIVNEVRAAIAPMTTAPWPDYIVKGDPITAKYFNSLKDFLNSVT